MATNVGDIMRLTYCQNVFSRDVCNVFYYAVALWTGNLTLTDVVNAFKDQVIDAHAAVATSDWSAVNVVIENVSNGVDFEDVPTLQVGQDLSTETLPPMYTVTYMFPRNSKVTRAARKAMSGLSEGFITGGFITPAQPLLDALGAAMSLPIEDVPGAPVDFQLNPVVVGRDSDGKLELTRTQPITSYKYPKLSTQNTRKD